MYMSAGQQSRPYKTRQYWMMYVNMYMSAIMVVYSSVGVDNAAGVTFARKIYPAYGKTINNCAAEDNFERKFMKGRGINRQWA